MNLQPLKDKIITVWFAPDRTVVGVLTKVSQAYIEVRCDGEPTSTAPSTFWQISRADIAAVGCNTGQ